MDDLIIGSHVSFKKDDHQLLGSVKEAISYGANTFMIYTGAPQNVNRSPINDNDTKEAYLLMKQKGMDIENVIVHTAYLINLANKKPNNNFAINFLKQEIKRTETLGIPNIVLHPGSYVDLGIEKGIENIISGLNSVIDSKINVNICIETMSGKGTEVGSSFEQIKEIIDGVENQDKIKVCLDTCHLHDAGYDLSDFDKVLDEFDKLIGIDKIACIHINDSKSKRGIPKDRHANIGYGEIGFDNLINIIYNPRIKKVPKILETPYVTYEEGEIKEFFPPYKFEIEMIKRKEFNSNLKKDIINYYK